MKKTLVLLLTLAMLASMIVSASAATTITVTGANPNETYTAYRILALESKSGDAISYTVEEDWEEFFTTGAGAAWFKVEGDSKYATLNIDISSYTEDEKAKLASDIANAAIAYAEANDDIDGLEGTVVGGSIDADTGAVTTGTVTFDVTDALGYYVIDTTHGTLVIAKNAYDNISVADKNEPTVVIKTVDDAEVAIGDTVTYTISFDGKEGATYTIEDKMDAGLTFVGITSVTVGTETYVAGTDYEDITATVQGATFAIKFKEALAADATVTIICTATVNENVEIIEANTNEVTIRYGNSWSKDTADVFTTDAGFLKYYKAADDTKEPLAGAKFVIYKGDATTPMTFTRVGTSNVYKVDPAGTVTEITTEADGEFFLKGLDEDFTYYYEETEAPEGYNKIDGKKAVVLNSVENNVGNEVENKTGAELPETGGAGTVAFTVVGSLLMLAAVVLFTAKKKMSVQD